MAAFRAAIHGSSWICSSNSTTCRASSTESGFGRLRFFFGVFAAIAAALEAWPWRSRYFSRERIAGEVAPERPRTRARLPPVGEKGAEIGRLQPAQHREAGRAAMVLRQEGEELTGVPLIGLDGQIGDPALLGEAPEPVRAGGQQVRRGKGEDRIIAAHDAIVAPEG